MAEIFLKPDSPLKKIDNTTGDTYYVYPQTTDDQVKMSNGQRLNTLLNENIIYYGEADVESSAEVINADTWSGHTPTTFLSLVYPVGAIYMSANPTSPDVLFGFGTWERIKDTFLLSAGDSYEAGSSGGEATHNHTLDNGHAYIDSSGNILAWKYKNGLSTWTSEWGITATSGQRQNIDRTSAVTLGGSTDNSNNMPPYLAVYVWKRTA